LIAANTAKDGKKASSTEKILKKAIKRGEHHRRNGGFSPCPVCSPWSKTALSVFFLAFFAASAPAQPLADPTQPPAEFAQGGEDAAAREDAPEEETRLDSVLLPKDGRPLAVIGGRQVRLGEYLGGRRLIRLTEREAVLEGPDGIERLFLTPGIEKTATRRESKAKASARTMSGSK
jgi:MSHA biogenesis protein MshK